MTEPGAPRVAVYLDFDNIVISRYDQVHGRNSFQKDKSGADSTSNPDALTEATVDVGAIIDFASSFGTLVLTRAYADWSADVNADYRGQLVGRAVDLVQLFPAAAYAKNGADIRLAVDAVEDMFRLPDLTHVVIVARRLRLHRPRAAVQAAGPLRRRHRRRRLEQPVAGRRLRRVRHLRRAARRSHTSRREPQEGHARRKAAEPDDGARARGPAGRGDGHCWSGRCGSATRRTTPTGCTTPRSRRR